MRWRRVACKEQLGFGVGERALHLGLLCWKKRAGLEQAAARGRDSRWEKMEAVVGLFR